MRGTRRRSVPSVHRFILATPALIVLSRSAHLIFNTACKRIACVLLTSWASLRDVYVRAIVYPVYASHGDSRWRGLSPVPETGWTSEQGPAARRHGDVIAQGATNASSRLYHGCCCAAVPPSTLPVQALGERIASRWADLQKRAGLLYTRASPVRCARRLILCVGIVSSQCVRLTHPRSRVLIPQYVKTGADYAWFVGSSALLLSLPILIELQRETTVMVLQRQRENEMAMMQEQARMMNASAIDNLRATANMMMGSAPAGGAAATADVGR